MRNILIVTGALLALGGCAQSAGLPNGTPPPEPTSFAHAGAGSPTLYVVNNMSNSVAVFAASAKGNAKPLGIISGSTTLLAAPINVAAASGLVYVSNLGTSIITEYKAGSRGNVAPVATISCGGLATPDGMAIDHTGTLYVANLQGNSISIFPRGTNGCASNAQAIAGTRTKLSTPASLLIVGSRLYVGNNGDSSIRAYALSARGNVAPLATIHGFNTGLVYPVGLAADAAGNLYVADDSAQSIFVFAAGANGNVAPLRTIVGSSTQLDSPSGIAMLPGGVFTVTNAKGNGLATFAQAATGNAKPMRQIAGAATHLDFPIGIALVTR